MTRDDKKDTIRKYVVQNAHFYKGVPNTGSVIGKIMAEHPEFKKDIRNIRNDVEEQVKWFKFLTNDEKDKQFKSLAPGMLKKEIKKQEGLPPLRDAVQGRVVTRFAPSPTGPLSIFQISRAVMLSYLYAEMYKGKFVVRIEDTDPKNVEKRYYEMIKEDLRNVGVKWDRLVTQSDRMHLYYKHAEKLIRDGRIYACFCPAEGFRKLKAKRQNCPCRDYSPKENHDYWKKAKKGDYREGQAVFRMKTSMQDPNPVLRDPPVFRINKARHPLKGRRYKMWPLYNWSCTIDDHTLEITHVFRGKEHEHNTAVQQRIYEALGWEQPVTINFGMVYLPGEKLHTRDVVERIKQGTISGWDDPSLPSVRALIRRGFRKEAFRLFAIQCGLTKHDINIDWETFYGINRRVIDPDAERYRVVIGPVAIDISGCIKKLGVGDFVSVQRHPDRKDTRPIPVTPKIFISREDFRELRNKDVRLIDLFNVKLDKKPKPIRSQGIDGKLQKIQWVPAKNVDVSIITPDKIMKGVGEPAMKGLKVDDVIQMLRVGFGRIDKKGKEICVFFSHK